jgi:hypothetical protein
MFGGVNNRKSNQGVPYMLAKREDDMIVNQGTVLKDLYLN